MLVIVNHKCLEISRKFDKDDEIWHLLLLEIANIGEPGNRVTSQLNW